MKVMLRFLFVAILAVYLVHCWPVHLKHKKPLATPTKLFPFTQGACNDSTDLGLFKSKNASFHELVMTCATGCAAEEKCTTTCLTKTIGLTQPCAVCWAKDVTCTAQNCFGPCLLPLSKGCTDCSIKYCQPGLLVCGGVNKNQIPNQ